MQVPGGRPECPIFPVDDDGISRAVTALGGGRLVILPTDTVYGIAADGRRDKGALRIGVAKGRPAGMPLQLLFAHSIDLVGRYARLSGPAVRLVDALGPGAWTIVTPAAPSFRAAYLGDNQTIGFRIPDMPLVHRIVERIGGPIAASSANLHGQPSPLNCEDAVTQVGASCELALDGGPCPRGRDSTVIDCTSGDVRILREGAIPQQEVARILGREDIPVVRSIR
ncbi:MAG: L-threonylcarbamoyladenylate synthase [Dehalococcoidia bacterium]